MFLLIGLLFFVYFAYLVYQHFFPSPNIDPRGKYVLISGCDTGFGHGLAIELDKQGFNVFVGIYDLKNEATLKNELSSRATIFRLDISRKEDIDAAYALVKEKTDTLHALVNNAGIYIGGYIDWTTMESMHQTMNVNFFGHVAMTKTFLPLLIVQPDSRVVNICSVSGFITLPSTSAYSASKYALESFSDCLRREMIPWGLCVSIIEPGGMKTPIVQGGDQALRNIWMKLPLHVQERWGEPFLNISIQQTTSSVFIKYAENPNKVVRALQHAVMNTKPRIRYRPGWQSSFVFYPFSMLPAWIIDGLCAKAVANNVPASVRQQQKK